MLQKYKGSYYKGNSIGSKQYRQKAGGKSSNQKSGWTGYILVFISIGTLGAFLYFNKKEQAQKQRDNIVDTIDLIEKVATYNLETDLAKNQSTHTARNASINHRNPKSVSDIQIQKQKALMKERKRQSHYLTQQYALDDGNCKDNINNTNTMKASHDQFYYPKQPINSNDQQPIPIDHNRQQQTNMMYDVQFGDKPYQNINSPFIHPEESTRPLAPQPKAFNNTLETGDKPQLFLQNVPSNVFKQNYFKATDSYESPYLSNINKIETHNNNGPIKAYNPSDFHYL